MTGITKGYRPDRYSLRADGRGGRSIGIFLAITTAFSTVFYVLRIQASHLNVNGSNYAVGLMWSPAVAAFLTIWMCRGDARTLGLPSFGGRFALLGYCIPLFYSLIAYGLVWAVGFGTFPNSAALAKLSAGVGWPMPGVANSTLFYFLLIATTGLIPAIARALGEEIGWRGFLAPSLVGQFGFVWGSILTGIIWVFWHIPILLFGDYHSAAPWWYALTCFTILTVSSSIILTWLRLRSNSVWPCAVLHASHNVFIQTFFTPLTVPRGTVTQYAIDEFGFALPAVVLILAIWICRSTRMAEPQGRDCAVTIPNQVTHGVNWTHRSTARDQSAMRMVSWL